MKAFWKVVAVPSHIARHWVLLACLFACTPAAQAGEAEWDSIRRDAFAGKAIVDAKPSDFVLYGPNQAADGAIVPISIHLTTAMAQRAKSLTLIIDRNPAPVAAVFHFGEAFREPIDIGDRIVATRIRVDSFSNVRAIIETSDGKLIMSAKFIAGAGGCSALPSSDHDEALASLGRMKVKQSMRRDVDPAWREALIMLRHPNYTGMQRDPTTGVPVPLRFVRHLEVKVGGRMLLRMDGGISISEDPNLRVTYAAKVIEPLVASGSDTDGTVFEGRSGDSGS